MSKSNAQGSARLVIEASENTQSPSLPLRAKLGMGLGITYNAVVDALVYGKDKAIEGSLRGRIFTTDVKEITKVAVQAGKDHRAEIRKGRLETIEQLRQQREAQLAAIQAVKDLVKS